MDPLRIPSLPTTNAVARTNERQAGARRGDPEAFRRAMQQRQDDTAPPDEQAPPPRAVRPMPRTLQRQALSGRKDAQNPPLHVDVIA